jgi:hypothetical protein
MRYDNDNKARQVTVLDQEEYHDGNGCAFVDSAFGIRDHHAVGPAAISPLETPLPTTTFPTTKTTPTMVNEIRIPPCRLALALEK